MDFQNTPSTRKNSSHLSRDQRLQILTHHKVGQNRTEISDALRITIHQVIFTIRSGCVDPGKRTGRNSKTSPGQGDELDKFVYSSRETRQMNYLELAMNFPRWNIGADAVPNAVKRKGYSRRIARNKPPLSVEHRRLRLEWAERHQSFSLNYWCHIIWSDETRINDGPVNKTHATRNISLHIIF